MINLFEFYSDMEKDLEHSLTEAGINNSTIVLQDDGFLPDHIQSPIRFFTDYSKGMEVMKRGMFFNEVPVPYYWEIRGDANNAEIYEGYKKKAQIRYSQRAEDYRIVKCVEWLNEKGQKRLIDYYDQEGKCFKKETYSDGELTLTSYLNSAKQEVILINNITGRIKVNFVGKDYFFKNFKKFCLFYFKVSGIEVEKIYYNSLSLPFFVINDLQLENPNTLYEHTLFWQEVTSKRPGNMQFILDSDSSTKHIIVQNESEYQNLKKGWLDEYSVSLDYLGYLYPLKEKKFVNKSVFTLTNSDQIVQLETLVRLLPDYSFNIAARTMMSSDLLAFSRFPNVNLYPVVDDNEIKKLLDSNSIYFDINHGNEVGHILREVFENNLLIFGFKEVMHQERYVDINNFVHESEVEHLVEKVTRKTRSNQVFQNEIKIQQFSGGQTTKQRYKEVLCGQ